MQRHLPERPRIALIEDDPVMGGALAQCLALEQYEVDWQRAGLDGLAALRRLPADALICDIRLPDLDGEEVFAAVQEIAPGLPMIFVTAFGGIDQAVRLVKAGAADYLTKPFEVSTLLDRLAELLRPAAVTGALGVSAPMHALEAVLLRVAALDSTLLLTGESGVGKEVAARFAHAASPRAASPFVAVNCAAIPDTLIESELFGHERGAFTGAERAHEGYLARAGRGTLFFDEVGDLPLATQAKLLRVVQEREFARLGAARAQRLEARVIGATHRDLPAMVREGRFREDLYYRLAVIPLAIPPLRERVADIRPLLEAAVAEFAASFGRALRGLSAEAVRLAEAHSWPGNVRELRNRAERAVALAPGAPTTGVLVTGADLFPEQAAGAAEADRPLRLAEVRAEAERRHIARVLEETGGHVEEAARRLGVSRSALFEKLKRQRG
jgi:DNA-binding NtrC family response regulator